MNRRRLSCCCNRLSLHLQLGVNDFLQDLRSPLITRIVSGPRCHRSKEILKVLMNKDHNLRNHTNIRSYWWWEHFHQLHGIILFRSLEWQLSLTYTLKSFFSKIKVVHIGRLRFFTKGHPLYHVYVHSIYQRRLDNERRNWPCCWSNLWNMALYNFC